MSGAGDWNLLPASSPVRPKGGPGGKGGKGKKGGKKGGKGGGGWTLIGASGMSPAAIAAQNAGTYNPGTNYVVGSGSTSDPGYQGLTDAQILARAQAQADANLGYQGSQIERLRQAAQAAAMRDENAITGLSAGVGTMISGIPAEITNIRNQAGAAIAGYGAGYTGAAKGNIQADQAAGAQTVADQTGGTAQAAPTVDPNAVNNAMYAQGGEIPATEQSQIGAASGNAAAGMPAVVARAGEEDVQQRMAQAASDDAGYRQQLVDLYAQRPQLVQDAMDKLYQIDQQKYGQWEAQQRLKLDQQQLALQQKAETFQEQQFGVTSKQKQQQLDTQSQTLVLKQQKQAADLQAAEAKGQKPDPALSRVYGYVVDSNGNPILDSHGGQIPVKQNGKDKAAAKQRSLQQAGEKAIELRGKPTAAPAGSPGKYLTDSRWATLHGPNMFPANPKAGLGPTTNNVKYAQYDGKTVQQAINILMVTYGINRAQARKIIAAVYGL